MASVNDCRGDACVAPTTVNEMTTSGIRPYLAYKSSGVEWLGDVPAHWEVKRLKNWLEVNQITLPENTDPDYTFDYLDIGAVGTGRLTAEPEKIRFGASPSRARRVVRPGDTIVSTVRTYLKAVWHAEDANTDLIASTGFAVLTPKRETSPKFVSYVCQSDPFTYRVTAESVGIAYPAIAETRLGTFDVCIPPFPEQTAIARFLDHADRRIRRYIRAKQKLVALLEEQKQAIIHQAVTGQIDVRTGQPYPVYKPSGIEWLGDVPAHWKVRRLKFLANISSGQVNPRLEEHRHKVLIAPNHIASGSGEITELETAEAQGADSGKYEIRVGDVVYSKIRPNLRKAAISPVDGLCSADMYPIRVRKNEISPSFFLHLLLSNKVAKYAVDCSMRVAMPKINREALGDCWLVYPAMPDQMALIAWISSETADLAVAIKRAQRGIDLLREYRTRLITDVVTGKLDVREAAAVLPEIDPLGAEDGLDDTFDTDAEPALDGPDITLEEAEA